MVAQSPWGMASREALSFSSLRGASGGQESLADEVALQRTKLVIGFEVSLPQFAFRLWC